MSVIDKPYDSARVAVFDISVSKNGEKVQPGGKVKITMPKPFESDGYVTYHVKGDNTVEELATTADGNNIYFETTSFSYFVVAGPGKCRSTAYTQLCRKGYRQKPCGQCDMPKEGCVSPCLQYLRQFGQRNL